MLRVTRLAVLAVAICVLGVVSGFVTPIRPLARVRPDAYHHQYAPRPVCALPEAMESINQVLIAANEAAGDDYVYGAVDAPGWVLPLGALLTIITAVAVPVFLRSGTEAFEEEKERLEEFKDRKPKK